MQSPTNNFTELEIAQLSVALLTVQKLETDLAHVRLQQHLLQQALPQAQAHYNDLLQAIRGAHEAVAQMAAEAVTQGFPHVAH